MKLTVLLSTILMLIGCQTFGNLGGVKPETVNQAFLLSYALIDAANESVADSIVMGALTDRRTAQNLRDEIQDAKDELDEAYDLFQMGREFDEDVFNNTRTALLAVRAALQAAGAETSSIDVEKLDNYVGVTA